MFNIVNSLNEYGYAISHIDNLFNDYQMELYSRVDQYYQEALQSPPVKSRIKLINKCKNSQDVDQLKKLSTRGKYYYLIQYDIMGKGFGVQDNIPIIELYTQDVFLDIAKSYLGHDPKVFDVITFLHPHTSMTKTASQNWHRDQEDNKQIKCFIYFNDVGESNGPLEFVPNTSRSKNPKINPSEKFDSKLMVGSKGTIVFFDGTNIHRGGHVKSGMRLCTQAMYLKPNARLIKNGHFYSFNRSKKVNWIDFEGEAFKKLPKRARQALHK